MVACDGGGCLSEGSREGDTRTKTQASWPREGLGGRVPETGGTASAKALRHRQGGKVQMIEEGQHGRNRVGEGMGRK